jgi:serine/threonine protein kinase
MNLQPLILNYFYVILLLLFVCLFVCSGATLEPKFCIVLEYCPRGSVHAFLKNMNNDLPWELFFKWSIQTCQGILVLHSWQPSPIVHRDLKYKTFFR